MNKKELVDEVSKKTGLSKIDSKMALEAILDTIIDTLSKNDSVNFIGFGTFTTSQRSERTARVPGTNNTVTVPATTIAKFKVGKSLKESVAK